MRAKIWVWVLVAALVAAAFFLPELLLRWGDSQLLDAIRIESQEEAREGFGESIQLTVPEKIMLLRSGALTVMELDRNTMERMVINTIVEKADAGADGAQDVQPGWKLHAAEEIEEAGQIWEERLADAGAEIRTLQTLGGLPELWKTDQLPEYTTGRGDLLYLDPETHMSFLVYSLSLRWENYGIDLLVDTQSKRILTFTLQWNQEGSPNWGPRGASGFGSAWRDYWKMDSVSTGWYSEYTRSVLENVESQVFTNGEYAAHDQITFMYDSQSLSVPLECQGSRSWSFSITWNR